MLRKFAPALPLVLVLIATAFGALLRAEVLVERYGTVDHPWWARVLTQKLAPLMEPLHPSAFRWHRIEQPYVGGDPIAYIQYGREMRGFYQAHVREPMFRAVTRTYLWLLDNQDVAVSFASATGSILTIIAVYFLGSAMLSRAAGVALSFIVAIEYDLISWSVDGWRDDVFMASATFCAWALLRCRREPSLLNGALVGVTMASACLTRVTALTFVVPTLIWLTFDDVKHPRKQRIQAVAVAATVCAILVAPYLINCAIATGDPFYAINYHTTYYRRGEGLPSEKPMSVLGYFRTKIATRPVATFDTAIGGLFVHPFTNKWRGIWVPQVAVILSWLSIVGLVRWIFLPEGRLMLVLLISSLAPYALTWNVGAGGEWRFTMHAYPLYLLASMSGIALLWQALSSLGKNRWRLAPIPRRKLAGCVLGMVAVAAVIAMYIALPWFVVRERVVSGADVSVEAGSRDGVFFGDGWSAPYVDGLTFRVSRAERATVRIPLPERRSYHIVLRLDPVAPEQQHRAVVLLNRQLLATLLLTWNPDRVGAYPLLLPEEKVRAGMNELTIVPDTLVSAGSAGARYTTLDRNDRLGVRLWYVRLLAPSGAP